MGYIRKISTCVPAMGNSKSAVISTKAAIVGSLCGGNVLCHHSLSARLRKKAELRIGIGPARAKLHFISPCCQVHQQIWSRFWKPCELEI